MGSPAGAGVQAGALGPAAFQARIPAPSLTPSLAPPARPAALPAPVPARAAPGPAAAGAVPASPARPVAAAKAPPAAPDAAAERGAELFDGAKLNAERIVERSYEGVSKGEATFTRGRDLGAYVEKLGPGFRAAIDAIGQRPDPRWLDSGGGEGIAVRQYLDLAKARSWPAVKVTLLAYETPARSEGLLEVLSGRFLEKIPDAEIAKSDIITDLFGPLSYSGQPHLVLQKYLDRLKDGGKAFIHLGAGDQAFGTMNTVVMADGKVVPFVEWLKTVPGLDFENEVRRIVTPMREFDTATAILTRRAGRDVRFPPLELIQYKDGMPPRMMFRESAHPGRAAKALVGAARGAARSRLSADARWGDAALFLDSLRSGEFTHTFLSVLSGLREGTRWLDASPRPDELARGLAARNLDFMKTGDFLALAQIIMNRRASRLDPARYHHARWAAVPDRSAGLITDYHGELQSDYHPSETMDRYLDALANDGELWLALGTETGGFGTRAQVLMKDGGVLPLRDWLMTAIPGVKVELHRVFAGVGIGERTSLRIRVRDRRSLKVPGLEVYGLGAPDEDGVPVPIYRQR